MPLKKGSSRENCISINYKELIRSGREKKVAQAASLNFCNKKWGGIPKKDSKKEMEILFLKADIDLELEDIKITEGILAKKKKWIQKAVSKKTKGDFGEWCKRNGFSGVSQACINKAAKAGGRASKMALFAVNVSKGKYHYPKKKKK